MERQDIERERKLLRTILIANESYFHNNALENLGKLYRDLMNFPRYYEEDSRDAHARRVVLKAMYQELDRRPSTYLTVLQSPYFQWWALTNAVLAIVTGILSSMREFLPLGRFMLMPAPFDFISVLPFIFGFAAVLMITMGGIGWRLNAIHRSKTNNMIRDLREHFELRSKQSISIRDSYPQA